ncbi:MAG: S8 family serine peptidase [Verrucomicrobiia bacterium]
MSKVYKHISKYLIVFLYVFYCHLAAALTSTNINGSVNKYHPSRLLVKPKQQVNLNQLNALHKNYGNNVKREYPSFGNLQTIVITSGKNPVEMAKLYLQSGLVEYAEPDYAIKTDQLVPNDPLYTSGSQWNLNNIGQFGGTPDADIDAPEGWAVSNTASNIVVAIIDSGVRYTHEDLSENMWVNPGEIPNNSIDDDKDGYVDDIYGINAIDGASNPGNPLDDFGHGTHVAGIIGAVGNNGKGVVGVAWRVKIMALKFIDSSNNGYVADAIECINYAINKGAKIINTSWGSTTYSSSLQTALNSARSAGIIVVASAGNESQNNDITPSYPASYNLDNIISVLATDLNDNLANYSNYGATSVDVGAPGSSIYSTFFSSDSSYIYLSGTSMAAPHVTGLCALAWQRFPIQGYNQIIKRVLESVDKLPSLSGKCVSGGRVNLFKLLSNYQIVYTNYSWVSTNGMTQISLSDNGISGAIMLPFPFNFYGSAKQFIYIGANGLLGFNTNGLDKTSNISLANTNTPNDAIYVYWDDLNPSSKGAVHYGVVGQEPYRQFVVTWTGVPRKTSSSTTLTFQAILQETTQRIIFQYQQAQPNKLLSGGGGSSATVGIENETGEMAAELLSNGNPITLTNNMAVVFIPYLIDGIAIGPARDLISSGPAGGPFSPQSQTYYITNTGGVDVRWAVFSPTNWVNISPDNGILSIGKTTNIEVSINTNGYSLNIGTHYADLIFSNLTSGAGSTKRSIMLTVFGTNAVLEVSPLTGINSSGYTGGPFSPMNALYTLLNSGDAQLEWRASCSANWITLSSTNGRLMPLASFIFVVTVNSNANTLPAGTYTDTILIQNITTGTGSVQLQATLTVNERPGTLTIIPDAQFESSGIEGVGFAPTQFYYTFTNSGTGSLLWSAYKTANWLSIYPTNGLLAAGETNLFEIKLTDEALNLSEGTYSDIINIFTTNGSSDRYSIFASLIVYPKPSNLLIDDETEHYFETFNGVGINSNFVIKLINDGGSNLFWSASASSEWIVLNTESGIAPPLSTNEIDLALNPEIIASLPPGNYTNTITFSNLFNPQNSARLNYILNIRQRPELVFSISEDREKIKIIVYGEADKTYIIETSANLYRWTPVYTNATSSDGIMEFFDNLLSGDIKCFYRARLP